MSAQESHGSHQGSARDCENVQVSTDRNAGRRAEVVLMCGVAGSGKTTYAKSLESDGFERLSIDEEIWRRFGRYGVDFAADDYQRLSDSVEYDLRVRLINLVRHGHDVVVDFSFWQRVSRDR
jgi:predicted kinase